MELRKHPRMVCLGRPNWPPEWNGPYGPGNPLPSGEVGILARVEPPPTALNPPHCIVVARYNSQEYLASLYFDDEDFCREVMQLLENCVGKPIAEIGSLDVPLTQEPASGRDSSPVARRKDRPGHGSDRANLPIKPANKAAV